MAGLDMDWRIWANGEEGKGYFINKKLFPDMAGFYSYAHEMGLSVYMNDHPMAKAAQLSPEEVTFRFDGLTSLFDLGLDFWWSVLLSPVAPQPIRLDPEPSCTALEVSVHSLSWPPPVRKGTTRTGTI